MKYPKCIFSFKDSRLLAGEKTPKRDKTHQFDHYYSMNIMPTMFLGKQLLLLMVLFVLLKKKICG